ncbi:MAG: hypothetical protein JRM78_02385 [Nitrososphaerota archaeon]|nr:hypothetical protein [Nitrososphaerota archaeon]MDG7047944.1 hypothetical protein [Nitrososphaerota archaeon]
MKTKEDNSKGDDDLRVRESRYIRMVKAIFHVCRRQRTPVYSSKYSGGTSPCGSTYIALIALMQRMRK